MRENSCFLDGKFLVPHHPSFEERYPIISWILAISAVALLGSAIGALWFLCII
mgnify:CR=1 FL=1